MNNEVRWLRIGYWVGIVADTAAAAVLLAPSLGLNLSNLDLSADPAFGLGLLFGLPLMVGWIVLLFWANQKPVERRDVLLITLFPVVIGFTAVYLYMPAAGIVPLVQIVPNLVIQIFLISVFSFSYFNSVRTTN